MRVFKAAQQRGAKLIDVGCMQINYFYHRKHFSSVTEMLQPRVNVDYAARFLRSLRQKEGNWTMAVAHYHAGPNNDPAQKHYICCVMRNMIANDFGQWTPNSRAFCKNAL